MIDAGAGANLRAERLRGARDGIRDRASAALLEPPRAERAVDLPHVVVQQHVRAAWRPRSEKSADDAARGLRGLERIELVPLVQIVRAGHRHQLVQLMKVLGAE